MDGSEFRDKARRLLVREGARMRRGDLFDKRDSRAANFCGVTEVVTGRVAVAHILSRCTVNMKCVVCEEAHFSRKCPRYKRQPALIVDRATLLITGGARDVQSLGPFQRRLILGGRSLGESGVVSLCRVATVRDVSASFWLKVPPGDTLLLASGVVLPLSRPTPSGGRVEDLAHPRGLADLYSILYSLRDFCSQSG